MHASVQMDLPLRRHLASPLERSWATVRQSIGRLVSVARPAPEEEVLPVLYSFQGECTYPDQCALDHENE